MCSKHKDEEANVAHLVKSLSIGEDDWKNFDNQSMDVECTKHDSKDNNVDNWEPNRYEVEQIIAHKVVNGQDLYLVMWRGYSKDTWEPVENLDDCRDKLYEFHKLSDEIKMNEQHHLYELDPEERNMFLNALHDSSHINFDLYDKIILGRTRDYDYLSEPRIESVPIAEISERNQKEKEAKQQDQND
ncbi:12800_t:CDS:2 [Cetraspora pellucida]|uniref:12800_t:CDS:1 n=1 Tax=Cetraspora pellucida TaxID=1433469 RepID=A0ACA9KKE2_9GLOM|nr:12800_t:CDS:2 [Cetraspora pellucida]